MQFRQIGWSEARQAGFFNVGIIAGIANHMIKQAKKENQEACCKTQIGMS